jgi:hypothetical protein
LLLTLVGALPLGRLWFLRVSLALRCFVLTLRSRCLLLTLGSALLWRRGLTLGLLRLLGLTLNWRGLRWWLALRSVVRGGRPWRLLLTLSLLLAWMRGPRLWKRLRGCGPLNISAPRLRRLSALGRRSV